MLTEGVVLGVIGLVATGTYGPVGARTNPVGPVAYLGLALATMGAAGVAWRRDLAADAPAAQSSHT